MQLTAPVARWSFWESVPGENGVSPSPDVGFVEPMLRRRLSFLARMTLRVAHDCAHDVPNTRFVFASRHGELARTTTMLESIADREVLSPMVFSMSVLNASTGLFSMLENNVAPTSAISAGESSFGYGLQEACLQWAEQPEVPVLYVYADEPAPAVYGLKEQPGSTSHAVGLLLQASSAHSVDWQVSDQGQASSAEAQSRTFLRCLADGASEWHGDGKTWRWARRST